MTRFAACVLAAVLFAAGPSSALPTPIGDPFRRLGEMETYQTGGEGPSPNPTPSPPAEGSSSSTSTAAPDTAQQWFEGFNRAVQKQLQLQESLMRQLMEDIQQYLSEALGWNENGSSALERVNAMLEMISSRMAITREAATEMAIGSSETEEQAAREATQKFMREVRVQDIVVDALWASLRAVQTSTWMSGITGQVEESDVFNAANRAAEEFLVRMYHNLRAAGIAEEDIVKYVPKNAIEETTSSPTRNMGRKSRGYYHYNYGYNYGYRYPHYSYYYTHPQPFYSYPVAAYPRYMHNYSWGYPVYTPSDWGSAPCFSSSCNDCGRGPQPEPLVHEHDMFHRALGEEDPTMMGAHGAPNPYVYGTPMMQDAYGTGPAMSAQGYNNGYPNYGYYPSSMNPRFNAATTAATGNMNYSQQSPAAPMGRMGSLGSPYGYTVTPNSRYRPSTFPVRNLGMWEGPEPMMEFMPFGAVEPFFF